MTVEQIRLPMVEIFETVEGEGTRAGWPTTFVRLFNCNIRCTWCDTKYSYAPHAPEFFATIGEIVEQVRGFGHQSVCLTGGEPLMHGDKSLALLEALAGVECVEDIHIETNGAIDLTPFAKLRDEHPEIQRKVRFVLDYKLPGSGETDKMIMSNYALLEDRDEIKFVIADEADYEHSKQVLKDWHQKGLPLFAPVWESMPPARLVELMLRDKLHHVKLNMQLHKIIWHPDTKGV